MRLRRSNPEYRQRLVTPVAQGGFWHLEDPPPDNGVALDVSVPVIVNEGRWVIECPFCGCGQFAGPEVDSFLCVDCANNGADGLRLRVVWPDKADEIEAELVKRPAPRNMNWRPHETVADLKHETKRRGRPDRQEAAAHVVAPGTVVHPDSEMA